MTCALVATLAAVAGLVAGNAIARSRCAGRHHTHDRITLRRPRRR